MTDFQCTEDAYETIAKALRFLSKRGENICFLTEQGPQARHHGAIHSTISGYSGGVQWVPDKPWGEGWEAYIEGAEAKDPPCNEMQSIVDHMERSIYDEDGIE